MRLVDLHTHWLGAEGLVRPLALLCRKLAPVLSVEELARRSLHSAVDVCS